jgi:hypothetical protein
VRDQLHAPAAFPQERRSWCPLYRRLIGPQRRSGRGGEEKNSQPSTLNFFVKTIILGQQFFNFDTCSKDLLAVLCYDFFLHFDDDDEAKAEEEKEKKKILVKFVSSTFVCIPTSLLAPNSFRTEPSACVLM